MTRLLCCLALILAVTPAWSQKGDDHKKDLEQFERKIRDQKERLRTVLAKEGSLHQELQRMASKVERLDREIAKIERDRVELDRKVRETGDEITNVEREIHENETQVTLRFRELYKWGPPSTIKILFSSESPDDFRRRQFLMRRWIEFDQKMIEAHKGRVGKLGRVRTELKTIQSEKERLARELLGKREEMAQERSDRAELLVLVRDQRDYHERNLRELERAAKELEALVEKLRKSKPQAESHFAQMKGFLIAPLRGTLEKRFGAYVDPKYNTTLYHKGLDIRAPEGTPIHAVFSGKVAYADWFVGYGKILIIDHGSGYFTLYAHVKDLLKKEGDPVRENEPIATVGDTGSLKGAYLYFELRYKGFSQDPWPWMAAVHR